MEKELINFILENNLNPFNKSKTQVKSSQSIFKTKDAKSVHNKALNLISKNFAFTETSNLFNFFTYPKTTEEITQRQNYFKNIENYQNSFLKELKEPRPSWNPEYDIVVVTENDTTLKKLKELNCAVKFLVTESDVLELENYDTVQVLDCENFSIALERLPQAVFLNSAEEAYLERYLRTLSGWKNNLEILSKNNIPEQIKTIINELKNLEYLYDKSKKQLLTKEKAEEALEIIKQDISNKVKELSISGDSLLEVLNQGKLPKQLESILKESINKTNLPEEIFNKQIPVSLDQQELEKIIREQNLSQFTDTAENIKKHSKELSEIPDKIKLLEANLTLFDFTSNIKKFSENKSFPKIENELSISNSFNEFLNKPSPINFHLNSQHKCSILTGANSGGKTTLLEHILQIITYSYLGLPVKGETKTPLFSEIYYFAKNKGSMNKGAFETLLTQISEIKTGNNTLILADEIEAVTEPGVAGKMISASAKYFIDKNCFLIFATHLGYEIKNTLPQYARIDGIEAKGLDENNELIVDHNPLLGKLASSTPELIIEKMARTNESDYFKFLNQYMKKS